jgi:hypothetical protein
LNFPFLLCIQQHFQQQKHLGGNDMVDSRAGGSVCEDCLAGMKASERLARTLATERNIPNLPPSAEESSGGSTTPSRHKKWCQLYMLKRSEARNLIEAELAHHSQNMSDMSSPSCLFACRKFTSATVCDTCNHHTEAPAGMPSTDSDFFCSSFTSVWCGRPPEYILLCTTTTVLFGA